MHDISTVASQVCNRRRFLVGGIAGTALLFVAGLTAAAPPASSIKVFKSPSCSCCGQWVEYMSQHGFKLEVENRENLEAIKKMARVPENLWSCHTSIIGNYVVEGHVPVEAVRELLSRQPKLAGIAVAGMPSGSPGMPGPKEASFKVIGFSRDGATRLFMRI